MGIYIQRHRDLTMPQNFLHDFGMNVHCKENSSRAMPKDHGSAYEASQYLPETA
jgi:hypothetical protein